MLVFDPMGIPRPFASVSPLLQRNRNEGRGHSYPVNRGASRCVRSASTEALEGLLGAALGPQTSGLCSCWTEWGAQRGSEKLGVAHQAWRERSAGQGGQWRAGPAAPATFSQPRSSQPWASQGWYPGTGTRARKASPGVSRSTGDFLKSVGSPFQRVRTLGGGGWRVPPCFWYVPPLPAREHGLHTAPRPPVVSGRQRHSHKPPTACKESAEIGSVAMPRLPLQLLC